METPATIQERGEKENPLRREALPVTGLHVISHILLNLIRLDFDLRITISSASSLTMLHDHR